MALDRQVGARPRGFGGAPLTLREAAASDRVASGNGGLWEVRGAVVSSEGHPSALGAAVSGGEGQRRAASGLYTSP